MDQLEKELENLPPIPSLHYANIPFSDDFKKWADDNRKLNGNTGIIYYLDLNYSEKNDKKHKNK